MDVTMFEPTGKQMKTQFPELGNISEFENLTSSELKFCWYVGNPTSPLIKVKNKKERAKKAIELSYSERAIENSKKVKKILDGEIPQEIITGIDRMSKFSLSHRLKAKFMDEYIFDKLNSLTYLDQVAETAMKADPAMKKQYADLVLKISAEMPELVERIETGYGVKLVKEQRGKVLTNLHEIGDRVRG